MRKRSLIDIIEYKHLNFFSFFLLLLWAIAPVIEFVFFNYLTPRYTKYFVSIIYFIGFLGIFEYVIYIIKKRKDSSLKLKDFIPQILIAILLFLSIISTVFSKNPSLSFFGEFTRKEGLLVYIMYIGFVLSASLAFDRKHIITLFKIIVFSAIIITTVPLFNNHFTYLRYTNIYHNANHYGYFLMISTMLAGSTFINTKSIRKPFYIVAYAYLTHMVILNDTFGCFLSILTCLVFSVVYAFIKKYKRVEIILLVLVFFLSSFLISKYNFAIGERIYDNIYQQIIQNNTKNLSKDIKTILISDDEEELNKVGTYRLALWKDAFEYTLKHPIIGGGMECLRNYYKNINDRPHNIVLQVSSFIGIPGALTYLSLIFYLALTRLKNINKDFTNFAIYITAMCYFISSLFGNSMYYTSPYFMILLGLLIGINETTKKESLSIKK